jgi:peptidoglycan DL-endopeptidase CwlO
LSGGIGRRLTFLFLILLCTPLVFGSGVFAEPAAITEAKDDAQDLQTRVDQLNEQLDAAVEDYNYAKAKLAQTKDAAAKTQEDLAKAQADYEDASGRLTVRLVEIYKAGELDALETLMGSSSFSDLINRLDLMKLLGEQDARLVADVSTYRDSVEARKTELAQQLEDEKVLAAQAETAKEKVEQQLAANEKALAGKEAEIAQLEKEEAARQAKLAEEARKRAAAAAKKAAEAKKLAQQKAAAAAAEKAADAAAQKAAAAAARKAAQAAGQQSSSDDSTPATTEPKPEVSVPDSASASDVVSIAMDYLGVPYVWGGSSPKGFDCSGLVVYVYRKVGISLPHSSRLQFGYGRPVARDDLQPGDLVFFHNPISHVGIYIGEGQMINAAGTGKGVRIDDVWASSYYGACRIID